VQGYVELTDQELADHTLGIRFAYGVCGSIVALGLLLANIPILAIAMIIAFFGMFPPYHPIDYLFNYAIRHLFKKPKLPPRANQGRFACIIATIWIGGIIYLLANNFDMWANILGLGLLASASLVTFTHICVPSIIFNLIFKKKSAR
jgi:hypothetical protein